MSGYGTATNDTHPRLSDAEMMANLRKENAELRQMLRDLVIGIGKELCDNADGQLCKGCSMNHVNGYCVVTDAMEILEEDA